METDASCIEVNVAYAKASGYHVAVDVEIPLDALYGGTRSDGGPAGSLRLYDAEADRLSAALHTAAQRVRDLRNDQPPSGPQSG